jgi:hypothetical protein
MVINLDNLCQLHIKGKIHNYHMIVKPKENISKNKRDSFWKSLLFFNSIVNYRMVTVVSFTL